MHIISFVSVADLKNFINGLRSLLIRKYFYSSFTIFQGTISARIQRKKVEHARTILLRMMNTLLTVSILSGMERIERRHNQNLTTVPQCISNVQDFGWILQKLCTGKCSYTLPTTEILTLLSSYEN